MLITLIYPGQLSASSALYPPLGLSYLASYLEANGFSVKIIDTTFEKVEDAINSERGNKNIYGIYTATPTHAMGILIAKKIKELDRDSVVVFGGPHPTVLPEETINDGADFVVVGEGEETFLNLIKTILVGGPLNVVDGIVFKENGVIKKTSNRPFIKNLDVLPFPDQTKFPIEKYFKLKGYREISMIASRGCPMNCSFCQPTLRKIFGASVRYRSPKNIVDEIEYLVNNFNADMIVFSDDTFCSNEQNVRDVCGLIIERKINVLWRCQTRVGLSRETMEIMKKAGCFLLALGVESGSQKILNSIRKGITVDGVIKTFKLCKEVGILTHAYFMVGHIGETQETIKETKELIAKIKPFSMFASIVTPYPQTDLYYNALENNLLLEKDWSKINHIQNYSSLKIEGLTGTDILDIKNDVLTFHKQRANTKIKDFVWCLKDFIFIKKVLKMMYKDKMVFKRFALLFFKTLKSKGMTMSNPYYKER